jgi:serine/threonine-protein kinase
MAINDLDQWDVWVYDWARGMPSRLTNDDAIDGWPEWAPHGRLIVFSSDRSGTEDLYWMRSDGTGDVHPLARAPNPRSAPSWHPSGRALAFAERRPETGDDLLTMEVAGEDSGGLTAGPATVFLSTPFSERNAVFSADGRWLAYTSDESGRDEVYVRPYPGPGGKWQVSARGGDAARWSRTSPELLFGTEEGEVMK